MGEILAESTKMVIMVVVLVELVIVELVIVGMMKMVQAEEKTKHI